MPNFLSDDDSERLSGGGILRRPRRLPRSTSIRSRRPDGRPYFTPDLTGTPVPPLNGMPPEPSIWSQSGPLQVPARNPRPTPRSPPPTRSDDAVDLRALDYVSNFDSHLMCPICHCPFIDPIRLECDHIFCLECFYDAIDHAVESATENSPICPKCRETVEATHGDVPRLIINMCDEVTVRCPFAAQGCAEIMERLHVQAHVDKRCGFKPMPCPDETCRKTIKRKDLDPFCHHNLRECEHCEEAVMELDMEMHLQEACPRRRECDQCHANITNVNEHRDSCPATRFPCPAAMWGCEKVLNRADFEAHKASCTLVKLSPHLKKMDDLKMRNELLENEVHRLKQTMSRMAALGSSSEQAEASTMPSQPESGALQTDTTNHLLSLHESLRTEIRDMDARSTMLMMNENLRIREDITHHDAALTRLRAEMDMMIRMRQQELARSRMTAAGISHAPAATATSAAVGSSSATLGTAEGAPGPSNGVSDAAMRSTSSDGRLRGIGRRSSDGGERVKL